ncbi:MAG: hypothetical protein H0X24_05150 [Ktedonobacterales bacterium]|nr:hypothetical protein [Ktedonobacterales bacterium]
MSEQEARAIQAAMKPIMTLLTDVALNIARAMSDIGAMTMQMMRDATPVFLQHALEQRGWTVTGFDAP